MIQKPLVHWLLAATMATTAALTACSASDQPPTGNPDEHPENSGSLSLELQASDGVFLDSLDYVVTGPDGYRKSGSIDLSHSNTLTGRIDGIPLASGYTLTLAATGRGNSATCHASAGFDILAPGTTALQVSLQCKVKETTRQGSLIVNGKVNVCPVIDNASAPVLEINVGAPLQLSATAHDPDEGPNALSYGWSASSGKLSDPQAANPTFTCAKVGSATLTLSVTDGDTCPDQTSFDIFCSEPTEPAPEPSKITFGIMSDTHVTPSKTNERARLGKAFALFSSLNLDAAVVAGDLTDFGSKEEYDVWKSIKDTYKGDVPLIASMGNHEVDSAALFEAATGNRPNDDKVINGYHFITLSAGSGPFNPATGRGASQGGGDYAYVIDWLTEHLDAAVAEDPNKPIFLIKHYPMENTIYASKDWGASGISANLLSNYPQVVTFSGHIHTPNNHPRSIWQDGGFTAVNTATLSYTILESLDDSHTGNTTPADTRNYASASIVEVEGSKVTIKNYDLLSEQYLAQTWSFDVSKPGEFPYTAARASQAKAPIFPSGASVRVSEVGNTAARITFDQATMESNTVGDIVHEYQYDFIDVATGATVQSYRDWSEFYLTPMPPTLTWQASGLRPGTNYEARVYATDAYRKKSTSYLSAPFKTSGVGTLANFGTPTIDGTRDAIWAGSTAFHLSGSSVPSTADARLMWDDHNLYVLVEVSDSTPYALTAAGAEPGNTHLGEHNDAAEIWLNWNNTAEAAYPLNSAAHFVIDRNNVVGSDYPTSYDITAVRSAVVSDSTHYVVEAAIPLSSVVDPTNWELTAATIAIDDDTDGVALPNGNGQRNGYISSWEGQYRTSPVGMPAVKPVKTGANAGFTNLTDRPLNFTGILDINRPGESYYYMKNDLVTATFSTNSANNGAAGSFYSHYTLVDFVLNNSLRDHLDWSEFILSNTMVDHWDYGSTTALPGVLDFTGMEVNGDTLVATGGTKFSSGLATTVTYRILPSAPVVQMKIHVKNNGATPFSGYLNYQIDPDTGQQRTYVPGLGFGGGLITSGWTGNYMSLVADGVTYGIAWAETEPYGVNSQGGGPYGSYGGVWFDASVGPGGQRDIIVYLILDNASADGFSSVANWADKVFELANN